ncbi:MAG: TonB-dependent receptor plug domain-containing protein [Thermoanaerobaculia bacterium]
MNEAANPGAVHSAVLYLPILTTIFSTLFATVLFRRFRRRGGGTHLLWWGVGMVTYGLGTFTESWTTLLGWHPTIFRLWYVTGAFLGGFPLAQGSIYLLMKRRFADLSARIAVAVIAIGAVLVFLSPLDLAQVELHRLSGKVLAWQGVRLMTPIINLYSLVFLAGGAALSAVRYRREPEHRDRYVGNILIAIGALLPGIGGTFTRFGHVEVLYVTELIGLLLIFTGYRRCVRVPRREEAAHPLSVPGAIATLLALVVLAAPLRADAPPATATSGDDGAAAEVTAPSGSAPAEEEPMASFFASTTVTATGSERDTFEVATPVTVLREAEIERLAPDSAADLLRDQPGVDVNGVGPNQARPVIRGQRGLRVLFLEDGLRLNNARRQTDFGEIAGLVDPAAVSTVEVVRGPASVLYGSDAIGGVLNLITRKPSFNGARNFTGTAQLAGASANDAVGGNVSVAGRGTGFDFQLGASERRADDYDAPTGRFGEIRLDEATRVVDTGLSDRSFWGSVGWNPGGKHSLELRGQRYRADDAGFGFVEPDVLGADDPFRIRILYPYQKFERWSLSYLGSALESSFADSLQVQLYQQTNRRSLVNDIDIDIGPVLPGAPSSSVASDTLNWTDLDTVGLRLEAIKALGSRHLLTWGAEGFHDDSTNTDHSETTTTFRFPFPPSVIGVIPGFTCVDFAPPFECSFQSTDDVANAPNATNSSWGVFAQDEWSPLDRLRVTAGLRYQRVATRAEATPGWEIAGLDFDDDALVGSVTATWQLLPELNLLASYGTAFRAPSIVERLFNGLTPEGSGYQILNPDLRSEESDNVDLGIKYRRREAYMELVAFRTTVDGGIVQHFLSPEEIAALPAAVRTEITRSRVDFVVQQQNAEQLRYQGIELALGWRFESGLTVGGNYTYLDADRLDSTNPPTGDTYGDKVVAFVRWQPVARPLWIEYRFRYNGSTDANLDPNEPVPAVGTVLPSFAIHSIAAGATLFERGRFSHDVRLEVENLTDELYAEFSNATFFRPEPGRNVKASWRVRF